MPDADHLVLAGVDDLRRRGLQTQKTTQQSLSAAGVASQRDDSVRVTLSRIDPAALPLLRSQPWFR